MRYSLTEKGRQLRPVIDSLHAWGEKWITPSKGSEKDYLDAKLAYDGIEWQAMNVNGC